MKKRLLIVLSFFVLLSVTRSSEVYASFEADADNLGFDINENYEPVERMYDTFYKQTLEVYYPNGIREYTVETYSAMLQDTRDTSYNIVIYRANIDPGKSKKWYWFHYEYFDNYFYSMDVTSDLESYAELIDFEPKNEIDTYSGSHTISVGTDGASVSATYNWSVSDLEINNTSSWGDDTINCHLYTPGSTTYTKGPSSHYGIFIYQKSGLSNISVNYDYKFKLSGRVGDDVFGDDVFKYYSDARWYDYY